MKKNFLIFLFLIFISCSKNDEVLVDLESYLNQGERVLLKKSDINYLKINEKKINKIKIKNLKNNFDWNQKYLNSRNFVSPHNISINEKKKVLNKKLEQIIIHDKNIITIDKNSLLQIYNLSFKKINSKKIYNRKIYKKFDLKFSIASSQGNIYVSDNLGNVHSYRKKDLKKNWSIELAVPFRSNIKIYKDQIFLINSNSKIFAINKKSGLIDWSFETASRALKKNNSYQVSIFDNTLFFTNDNGEIFSINMLEKNINWSLILESKDDQNIPYIFESSPISIDDEKNLFISSNYGLMYCIDPRSGFIKWSKFLSSTNKFIIYQNFLFLVSNRKLVILNKKNGNIIYNQDLLSKTNISNKNFIKDFVIGEDSIYLFINDGYLISIKLDDLNKINKKKLFKGYNEYAVSNKNIYIVTEKNLLKY